MWWALFVPLRASKSVFPIEHILVLCFLSCFLQVFVFRSLSFQNNNNNWWLDLGEKVRSTSIVHRRFHLFNIINNIQFVNTFKIVQIKHIKSLKAFSMTADWQSVFVLNGTQFSKLHGIVWYLNRKTLSIKFESGYIFVYFFFSEDFPLEWNDWFLNAVAGKKREAKRSPRYDGWKGVHIGYQSTVTPKLKLIDSKLEYFSTIKRQYFDSNGTF